MPDQKWLPVLHNSMQRRFVVFGGGRVATRKISMLLRFDCEVTLVSPDISERLNVLVKEGRIQYHPGVAEERFIAGDRWVVAATDVADVNREISVWARRGQCPVSVADAPELSDFIFPAIIDRSPVMVAVSSSGQTPALTRYLRNQIDAMLPSRVSELALFAESLRARIRKLVPEQIKRQSIWRALMSSPVPDLVLAGKEKEADDVAQAVVEGRDACGQVFLVGSGPGDPDLLTMKAVRLIQQADVVFYDRLVSKDIMAFCSPTAELRYVGKAKSDHAVPQQGINRLLVEEAQKGRTVLRLKGGDPFIFGRGGEEIEELAEAGIPFQVVPGITAASGCAAYSGIPLTHRDYAQSVRFVTGHLKDGTANLPWDELIHDQQTLVIYMGLSGIRVICEKLVSHGMNPATPIALIEKGTLPGQKVHVSTLENMPGLVDSTDISAPTLTVVGSVVELHDKLNWRG